MEGIYRSSSSELELILLFRFGIEFEYTNYLTAGQNCEIDAHALTVPLAISSDVQHVIGTKSNKWYCIN